MVDCFILAIAIATKHTSIIHSTKEPKVGVPKSFTLNFETSGIIAKTQVICDCSHQPS